MDGEEKDYLEGVCEQNQVGKTATIEQEAKPKQKLERVLRLADSAHQRLDPVHGKVHRRSCILATTRATRASSASVGGRKAVIVI